MHWTIPTAAEAIRMGQLTPINLLEICLERIDRYEKRVRAWVFVDREGARSEAKILANELQRGRWRGPLHGIPLGIKDIFDAFDWPTAAGSRLWAQSIARHDATVVTRLRQAGAIFVGKTVTTQYASFDPPCTRNPWNLDRTPGGSSSGSAAALACGMCLGALASQTGGSITRPAAFCGVPGCKPTFGRVSGHGVLPLAPSMDHVGAMGRCVGDLAILMETIAGADFHDPLCSNRPVPNFTALLADRLPPPRLGRTRGFFEQYAEPDMVSLMENIFAQVRSRGASVGELALPAAFSEVVQRHRTVMAVEGAAYHEKRLRQHPEDYGPKITGLLEEGLACPAPEYGRCKQHQKELGEAMIAWLGDFDALVTPATTGPAPDAATTGNPIFNSPWSYTGMPTICVNAGWSEDGLPMAIQLVGSPWQEAKLMATAKWFENCLALEPREPPVK